MSARQGFDLVTHLVAQQFRLRYRQSALGWLWSVSQPLLRMLIFAFVFSNLFDLSIPHYSLFLFIGIVSWTWFSAGVISATHSMINRSDLVATPGVRRPLIPAIAALVDGLDVVASLPVLGLFLVVEVGVHPTLPLLVPLLVLQAVMIVGLGSMLCIANVYLRDVALLVETALFLGFYLTPVFYDAGSLDTSYGWVISANPMARMLEMQRDVLVAGRLPTAGDLIYVAAVASVLGAGGWLVVRRFGGNVLDEL